MVRHLTRPWQLRIREISCRSGGKIGNPFASDVTGWLRKYGRFVCKTEIAVWVQHKALDCHNACIAEGEHRGLQHIASIRVRIVFTGDCGSRKERFTNKSCINDACRRSPLLELNSARIDDLNSLPKITNCYFLARLLVHFPLLAPLHLAPNQQRISSCVQLLSDKPRSHCTCNMPGANTGANSTHSHNDNDHTASGKLCDHDHGKSLFGGAKGRWLHAIRAWLPEEMTDFSNFAKYSPLIAAIIAPTSTLLDIPALSVSHLVLVGPLTVAKVVYLQWRACPGSQSMRRIVSSRLDYECPSQLVACPSF